MSAPNVSPTAPARVDAGRVATIPGLRPIHYPYLIGPACLPVARDASELRRPIPTDLRAYLYARDGRICRRCGAGPLITAGTLSPSPIDGRLVVDPSPYITLDHVIPWRQGGCDHGHNLRVLCNPCNAALGDGVKRGNNYDARRRNAAARAAMGGAR